MIKKYLKYAFNHREPLRSTYVVSFLISFLISIGSLVVLFIEIALFDSNAGIKGGVVLIYYFVAQLLAYFVFSLFFVGLYFAIVNLFRNVKQRPLQRAASGVNSKETEDKKEQENRNFSRVFLFTSLMTALCIILLISVPWANNRNDINDMIVNGILFIGTPVIFTINFFLIRAYLIIKKVSGKFKDSVD